MTFGAQSCAAQTRLESVNIQPSVLRVSSRGFEQDSEIYHGNIGLSGLFQ